LFSFADILEINLAAFFQCIIFFFAAFANKDCTKMKAFFASSFDLIFKITPQTSLL